MLLLPMSFKSAKVLLGLPELLIILLIFLVGLLLFIHEPIVGTPVGTLLSFAIILHDFFDLVRVVLDVLKQISLADLRSLIHFDLNFKIFIKKNA